MAWGSETSMHRNPSPAHVSLLLRQSSMPRMHALHACCVAHTARPTRRFDSQQYTIPTPSASGFSQSVSSRTSRTLTCMLSSSHTSICTTRSRGGGATCREGDPVGPVPNDPVVVPASAASRCSWTAEDGSRHVATTLRRGRWIKVT